MITVVGGAGFIGTYLCEQLSSAGIPFEIVDIKPSARFPSHSKIADIRNIEDLRSSVTGSTVVHLAAVHRDDVRDKSSYYETNVNGTRNICCVADEKAIRKLIFTSSVAVYGFALPGTGEDGEIAPFNDYGTSKFQAEEVLREWRDAHDGRVSLTIIRPTVVFGPGNRGNVFNLLNQVSSGLFMMVGSGKNVKSLAYVENIAAFLRHAMRFEEGYRLVNYVDKPDLDMNHLVSLIRTSLKGKSGVGFRIPFPAALAIGRGLDAVAKITGKTFPLSAIRVRKFCADTQFTSAAHAVPGFTAPHALIEGLDTTLRKEFLSPDTSMGVFFTE